MTHVYNTSYVCYIQIPRDHRGCDRLRGEPPTPWCVPYPTTCHQRRKLMSRLPNVQHAFASPPLCYPLTCSVRFTQADLGDAAGVTLWSPPLQHAILIQPVRWCHGGWEKAQCKTVRCNHRQPRSPASSGGADLMWLDCCSCSSWSPIRSSAGEIHYARSITPPSRAARKPPLNPTLGFVFD